MRQYGVDVARLQDLGTRGISDGISDLVNISKQAWENDINKRRRLYSTKSPISDKAWGNLRFLPTLQERGITISRENNLYAQPAGA